MGLAASTLWENIWTKLSGFKECRILMIGLDNAGKTTILYNLHLGEGFNVESVQYKNISFTVWDIGGQDKIRRLWNHYYDGNNGIIFVVDSNDTNRVLEAREELQRILQEDRLRDAVILVFANKQDLPNAMSASELTEKLGLQFNSNRKWYVQPCCATTKAGLFEGLDWLSKSI